jgi:hypothetical protein
LGHLDRAPARLEIEPGSPVIIVKGTTQDQEVQVLHSIDTVTASGRMRYGALSTEN